MTRSIPSEVVLSGTTLHFPVQCFILKLTRGSTPNQSFSDSVLQITPYCGECGNLIQSFTDLAKFSPNSGANVV